MKNSGIARAWDQWLSVLESRGKVNRRERAHFHVQKLKKLARAMGLWRRHVDEAISRGRIRQTFQFAKPPDEDLHAEAVDWRASLKKGRTKGDGYGL